MSAGATHSGGGRRSTWEQDDRRLSESGWKVQGQVVARWRVGRWESTAGGVVNANRKEQGQHVNGETPIHSSLRRS